MKQIDGLEGLKQYKLYAFGNPWKVAYLDGRDSIIDMVLPKYLSTDTIDNPSSLCKMMFKYDHSLNGYNLIGVMELDDDPISLMNKDVKQDKVEGIKDWDWSASDSMKGK